MITIGIVMFILAVLVKKLNDRFYIIFFDEFAGFFAFSAFVFVTAGIAKILWDIIPKNQFY